MKSIVERVLPIPDFDGYYASKKGKIYSTLGKGCRDRYNLEKRVFPKELKYRITKNGYARVYMRKNNSKRVDVYVHRIIGDLYVPNPNNLPEINHIDNKRLHNEDINLEWVTREENINHAMNYGYMTRNEKGQFTHK